MLNFIAFGLKVNTLRLNSLKLKSSRLYVHINMRVSVFLLIVMTLTLTLTSANAESIVPDNSFGNKSTDTSIDKNKVVAEKFYRQALFYYFQNQPQKALTQLAYNHQRFGYLTQHAKLFEAGLQSKQGLYTQANQSLSLLLLNNSHEKKLAVKDHADSRTDDLNAKELESIVLLQLAEQYYQNGQSIKSKQTLNKLTYLPESSIEQFTILHQQLYWPVISPINYSALIEDNSAIEKAINSPYIKMNHALALLQNKQYEKAKSALLFLRDNSFLKSNPTFWQSLFSSKVIASSGDNSNVSTDLDEKDELRAISQYAQLLLAQLYAEQTNFEASYQALNNFDKNSPFTEQALFLYGYAAYKRQFYQESNAVLNLLIVRYPYSNFTRQALALIASNYVEQKELNLALNQYIAIESYYQNKMEELGDFKAAVAQSNNFLTFKNRINDTPKENAQWLTLAMNKVEVEDSFKSLEQITTIIEQLNQQNNKALCLQEVVNLNDIRKGKIAEQQKTKNYPSLIQKLSEEVTLLKGKLNKARLSANGYLFASPTQKQWLNRISKSEIAINTITGKKNTQDYQERLNRVQGVLSWQLHETYPDRAWQYEKRLKELESALNRANNKYETIVGLVTSGNEGSAQFNRGQALSDQISQESKKALALFQKVNTNIHQQLIAFVEQQETELAKHLLYSQNHMAKVIERLNVQEEAE